MKDTINEFIEVMEKAFELSEKIAKGNPDVVSIEWDIQVTGRNGIDTEICEKLTDAMKKAGITV